MDATAKTFWDGCERGELGYQKCEQCRALQYYPRPFCRHCGSRDLATLRSRGYGSVYSHTEIIRAPTPSFRSLVPYTIALVDLDEGVRVMAHAEAGLTIGERVELEFFVHETLHLPRFKRA